MASGYGGCKDCYSSCGSASESAYREDQDQVRLRTRDKCCPEAQPSGDNESNLEESQVALRFRDPVSPVEKLVNARQFGGVPSPAIPKMTFLKRWAQSVESTLPMLPRMSALF